MAEVTIKDPETKCISDCDGTNLRLLDAAVQCAVDLEKLGWDFAEQRHQGFESNVANTPTTAEGTSDTHGHTSDEADPSFSGDNTPVACKEAKAAWEKAEATLLAFQMEHLAFDQEVW